jgi:hypothetical protein
MRSCCAGQACERHCNPRGHTKPQHVYGKMCIRLVEAHHAGNSDPALTFPMGRRETENVDLLHQRPPIWLNGPPKDLIVPLCRQCGSGTVSEPNASKTETSA